MPDTTTPHVIEVVEIAGISIAGPPGPPGDNEVWVGPSPPTNPGVELWYDPDAPTSQPYINVRDYGAKGDGTTDDTAAIQAALDAAGSTKGTVLVPTGTFNHDGLTIPDFVTLRGVGHQGSILRYTGTTNGVTLGNQATLSAIHFTKSGTAGTSRGLVFVPDAARWVIDRCHVSFHAVGIYVAVAYIGAINETLIDSNVTAGIHFNHTDVNNIQVRGGEIKGSVTGVQADAGNNIVLDGVAIEGNTTYGVRVQSLVTPVHGMVISKCYFEQNGTFDIRGDSGGYALNVTGCMFVGNTPTNIYLYSALAGRIEGNWFQPQGGASPKSIVLDAQWVTDTYIGPNCYIAGAFNPAVDDRGVNTKIIGRTEKSIPFPDSSSYSAAFSYHVYVATLPTEVTDVRVCVSTALPVSATNYWKMTLYRFDAAGAYLGVVGALGNDTTAFAVGGTYAVPSLDPTQRKLAAGQSLKLVWDKVGTPASLVAPMLTIRVKETLTP